MNAVTEIPHRLSLLDDEEDIASGVERRLSREGYALTRVVPETSSLQDTIDKIIEVSDAALCDHHLRGGHQVAFSGADVVARLTALRFPAVLFTGMLPQEKYAIRRNMASIPAFINRDDGLSAGRMLRALEASVAEVREGIRRPNRRGRRTPVTVVGTRSTAGERLVEVLVSGWSGGTSIEIPVDMLAEPWRNAASEAVGRSFLATVNIAEPDPNLLFFSDFEAEPLVTDVYEGV
jgi:CheY-like chemotaxis protein